MSAFTALVSSWANASTKPGEGSGRMRCEHVDNHRESVKSARQQGSGRLWSVQALVAPSAHRNHRMVIRHGVAVADGRASTREVRALNAANEAEKEHARLHIPASATWEQATQPGGAV
eukprot:scaffold83209_cov67-Phaeocystis_antarctica.AAC.3